MLDPDALDLSDLCMALEDNSSDHAWWLNPRNGELELWSEFGDLPDDEHPDERGLVYVEPIGSHEAYADMEDFIGGVSDATARDLLERAIAGRGAFRRFKDTLLEFPELREAWFAFHDARMQRRAIQWLQDRGLVAADAAERALAARTVDRELPVRSMPLDAHQVALEVARDLRDLYGDRLETVVLFGSWARGEAHPESDIDLLVVLDDVRSRRAELARMSDVLWRHSLEHDTVVTELPVSRAEYRDSDEPVVARARSEGVAVL